MGAMCTQTGQGEGDAGVLARVDFASAMLPEGGLSFSSFDEVVQAWALPEVLPALARIDAACRGGSYAVGFLAYEAAPAFDAALSAHPPLAGLPLLWFGLSKTPATGTCPSQTSAAVEGGVPPADAWRPHWPYRAYAEAFAAVQAHIRAGDTYQVNLTFPLSCDAFACSADAYALYRYLLRRQRGDYGAYLDAGSFKILSLSPELFFQRCGREIITMPMKGTAPRGLDLAGDLACAERLRTCEKERAENLMIVDLLRNDLGRLAEPGGVRVPQLLQTRRYPTLWQLTSTVEATLPPGYTPLSELLRALFPCGSVTGAPKARTTQIIRELEPQPRGVYCGALGVVLPGGDCVFNVPIRTLLFAGGQARYSVGGGLVADAVAESEYAECLLKARVLTRHQPAFDLLETMLWTPAEGYVLLEEHLQRLRDSAAYFLRPLDEALLRGRLSEAVAGCAFAQRVRLLVSVSGEVRAEASDCPPPVSQPVRLRIAESAVDSGDPFLYHKTTHRAVYDMHRAHLQGAFDVILFNERGELTETTICNLALQLEDGWFTPPVSSGLLAGVERGRLLASGEMRERVLYRRDLARAKQIMVFNSLRGCMAAVLAQPPATD